MKTTLCISLLALLAIGCDKATKPGFDESPEEPKHTIAYLKSLCSGKNSIKVTQDITITGFVTANDLYGEFYKTLVVEDSSGGISIAVDHPTSADDYPFGIIATVRCNGLTLYNYGGKIQLGTTPDENGVGRIPREELPRYIGTELPGSNTHRASVLSFNEISPQRIDTRVRFDGVHFEKAGTWCDIDPETHRTVTTERTIVDSRGQTFIVRTAGTCAYAKEPVPQGTGSLYGIIDYFAGQYTLHVTNREIVFTTAATHPTAYP